MFSGVQGPKPEAVHNHSTTGGGADFPGLKKPYLSIAVGGLFFLAWVAGCLVLMSSGTNSLSQFSGTEWALVVIAISLPLFLACTVTLGLIQKRAFHALLKTELKQQIVTPTVKQPAGSETANYMSTVADEFDARLETFHAVIDNLSGVLVGMTAQVESQNQTLDQLTERVSQHAVAIGSQIQHQTKMIDDAAAGVDLLMDRVNASASQMRSLVKDMQAHVEEPFVQTAQAMQTVVADMEDQLERLDLRLARVQQDQQTTLATSEKVQERLTQDSDTLRLASEAALANIDAMSTRLADHITNMDDICLTAVKKIAHVQQEFTAQAQNLGLVSENLSGQIHQISSAIEDQNHQLASLGQTASAYGDIVVEHARKNADALNMETEIAVEKLSLTMDGQLLAMNQYVESQSTYMEGTARRLEKRLTETLNRGDQVLENLTQINAESVSNLNDSLTQTLENYREQVSAMLQALNEDVADLSQNEVEALDLLKERVASTITDLHEACETSITQMSTRASATANLLETQAESLDARLVKVSGASENVHTKLSHAAEALGRDLIEALDARVREHSTDANASIQTLSNALDSSLAQWREKLDAAIETARDTSHAMVAKAAENLQHLSETSSDAILDAGQKIPTLAASVVEAAGQARQDISDIAADLHTTLAHVVKTVDETSQTTELMHRDLSQAPARLDAATEALSVMTQAIATHAQNVEIQANSFEASSDKVLTQIAQNTSALQQAATMTDSVLENQNARLNRGTKDVETATQAFANNIESLTAQAEDNLTTMTHMSNSAVGAVAQTSQTVGHQIQDFSRQASNLKSLLDSIGGLATEHGQALKQVGEQAESRAQRLMSLIRNDQRDAFLGSAESIVDRLHGLAIDVSSILDGELDPATVQAFQQGDRGVSVRRLLASRTNNDSMARIAQLYRHDRKFKERVDLYIAGFEDLLKRAAKADSSKLVHTTFLTADIGKLYVFLTQSLGLLAAAE